MRRRTQVVILSIVVLFFVIRAVAPAIILSRLNAYLATFSPVYSIHVGDLDLGLLTFSYTGENTEGVYKKTGAKFFETKKVRVQVSFRELLRLRILTNVRIDDGSFILTKALLNEGASHPETAKEDAKKASRALFPLRIAKIELHDCAFDFSDYVPSHKDDKWRVSEINAKILNINPRPKEPITEATAEGKFLNTTPFHASAKGRRLEDPIAWKVDFEMKDFKLTEANPMLMHLVPFSFTKGHLDVYSEVASKNGDIQGYVKPFFRKVAILKTKGDFQNAKQFIVEIVGAFTNFILKNADDKTLATKIEFTKPAGGAFKIDALDALLDAIKNGYFEKLKPGLDNSIPFK